MHIERGFFRSVSGEIGKLAPERFKVKTVSSTIGIRGTDFSAALADTYELFKCYKGEISVLHEGKTYIVPAGEELRLEKKSSLLNTNILPKFYAGSGLIYNRVYSTHSSWFADNISTQDETGGISLIGGYQFNDYLAVESRITKTFFERNYSDTTSYSMFLKPQYPVTDTFSVYALVGFGKVKVEGSAGDSGFGAHTDVIGKTILDRTQFQWGVGISYSVIDNFSIFADYTSLAKDADIESTLYSYDPATYHKLSVDGVTVGILYRF
jgi:opacity protein-like surface antigen